MKMNVNYERITIFFNKSKFANQFTKRNQESRKKI